MNKLFYILFLLLPISLFSQEKLTNSFHFADGIYMSIQEMQGNNPSLKWDDVRIKMVVYPDLYKAKTKVFILTSDSSRVDMKQVWGISYEGIPYVKVGQEESGLYLYAALEVRGNICYYKYTLEELKKVEISAYNPETGKPFRSKIVERKQEVEYKKILRFQTGEIQDFTLKNVAEWIAADSSLWETFKTTLPEKRQRKLLTFIRIFNDRNAIEILDVKTQD